MFFFFALQGYEYLMLICEIYLLSRCRSRHTLKSNDGSFELQRFLMERSHLNHFITSWLEQVAHAILPCFNIV